MTADPAQASAGTLHRDLTWTGNQFLDPAGQLELFLDAVRTLDLTTKNDTWSRQVASAVADHFGLLPAQVRVAAGATQLIEAALRASYRGLVVDVVPNFHLAATVSAQEGWNYQPIAVREPAELIPALADQLDRPESVISLSSPRNPLGYQFELPELIALLERARGTVLLDEVYADFAPVSALELIGRFPNLIVVRTFSKAWGLASLRVGFAASSAFADEAFTLPLLPNSVSGVAQRMVTRLLAEPAEVHASIDQARQARDWLLAELATVSGLRAWPSAANFICVESELSPAIAAELQTAGYPVRVVNELRGYPGDWPLGIRIVVPPLAEARRVLDRILAVTAAGGST